MEAVLDTNVVVSAVISPKGPPAEIFRAWRADLFSLVTSEVLMQELERTLKARRLARFLPRSSADVAEFVGLVRDQARLVTPQRRSDLIKDDRADDRVLEAAAEGSANYVATGDQDLLKLGRIEEIEIVPPARFVAIIRVV